MSILLSDTVCSEYASKMLRKRDAVWQTNRVTYWAPVRAKFAMEIYFVYYIILVKFIDI